MANENGDYGNMNNQQVADERQRRVELCNKYKALRSLVPYSTKTDRLSILGDAIVYIHELQTTVKDLKLLVDNERDSKEMSKRPMTEEEEEETCEVESSNAKEIVAGEAAEDHQSPLDRTESTCQLCNKYGHFASHCYLQCDQELNNPYAGGNANRGNGSKGNDQPTNDITTNLISLNLEK